MRYEIEDVTVELPMNWQEIMTELAEKGCNWIVWVRDLDIVKDEHYLLLKEIAEYKDHYDRCRIIHDAYWNELFRMNVSDRQFNAQAWLQYMKENCGYSSKTADDLPKRSSAMDVADKEEVKKKYGIKAVEKIS